MQWLPWDLTKHYRTLVLQLQSVYTRRSLNGKEAFEIRCTTTTQINNNRQDKKVYLITLCIALQKEIDTIFWKIQSRFHSGRRVLYFVWRRNSMNRLKSYGKTISRDLNIRLFGFSKRVRNISRKQDIHMECRMEETSEQETQFQWRLQSAIESSFSSLFMKEAYFTLLNFFPSSWFAIEIR